MFNRFILISFLFFAVPTQAAKVSAVEGSKVLVYLENAQDEEIAAGETIYLTHFNKRVATLIVVNNRGLMAETKVVAGRASKNHKVIMPYVAKQQAAIARAKSEKAQRARIAKEKALAKARAEQAHLASVKAARLKVEQERREAKANALRLARQKEAARLAAEKALLEKEQLEIERLTEAREKMRQIMAARKAERVRAQERLERQRREQSALVSNVSSVPKVNYDESSLETESDDNVGVEEDYSLAALTKNDRSLASVATTSASDQRVSMGKTEMAQNLSRRNWRVGTEVLQTAGVFSDYSALNVQIDRRILNSLSVGAVGAIGSYGTEFTSATSGQGPGVNRIEYGLAGTYNFSGDIFRSGIYAGAQFRLINEEWGEAPTESFTGGSSSSSVYSATLGYQYIYGMLALRLGYQLQQAQSAEIADFGNAQFKRTSANTFGSSSQLVFQLGLVF